MDSAGRDIQQLCLAAKSNFEINRRVRQWLEDSDTKSKATILDFDRNVEVDSKIAFKCILNSYHATDVAVGEFLQKKAFDREIFTNKNSVNVEEDELDRKNTTPFSLHDQDLRGITALHVAVYRNSLHADKIAKLLLDWSRSSNGFSSQIKDSKEASLASIPMVCGSYPLHLLTGQNLTIKEHLLETLLCEDPSIPFKDDVNGDNPISLLWKNTLRFRWAISVMEGATFIDYIKNNDRSWMAIITPHQYIQYSLRMAVAALQKPSKSQYTSQNTVTTIHDLCRIPRCPPMLLRLLQSPEYNAFFGVNGNAFTLDEHGMLPIHHAVQHPPVTYTFVPSSLKSQYKTSLVEMLLEENPGGVRVADDQGRLPLHYALESGCVSEKDLMALMLLYPESLRIEDPKNGLLPFMMVSMDHARTTTCCSIPHDSFHDVNGQELSSSMYQNSSHVLETRESGNAGNYQAEWKKDHVRMTYFLLMRCPDVISWTNADGINQKPCNKYGRCNQF